MKLFGFTLLLFSLLLWNSCNEDSQDCLCTEEFRMYFVIVVDSLKNPVDSLQTTVTSSGGKEYNFSDFSPPPNMPGAYFVMTDGYENDFTVKPEIILFTGNKNGKQVNGEFFFNTDECRCHVYKIAGPDTLVLN